MNWTPLHIELLLNIYCHPQREPGNGSDSSRDYLAELMHFDLIKATDMGCYEVKPRGEALIRMWEETPLPEIRYVDPRIKSVEGQIKLGPTIMTHGFHGPLGEYAGDPLDNSPIIGRGD